MHPEEAGLALWLPSSLFYRPDITLASGRGIPAAPTKALVVCRVRSATPGRMASRPMMPSAEGDRHFGGLVLLFYGPDKTDQELPGAAESIAVLDARFPWLRDAEKRWS